ncbi:LemA family protein [Chitinilyticum litopenaei]|uniref:LemA family protein n=1 Tax=Chitinilyticum litopenaei TaxID=1121276 RepID=UPI000405A76A|nr:LemA family protein [Chitinilyticum litopenaei]
MPSFLVWAIPLLLIIVLALLYNFLVSKRNQVEFAFASIDAQFKKRYDLIPNLVSVCEKYMGYEERLLKDLAASRSNFMQSSDDGKVSMDGQACAQLRSVMALAESYPELKASSSFESLERALNEVEEQLAAARRAFNAAVTDYNNACQMFPTSILASMMGLKERSWFEATAEEREPVRVWR